MPSEHPSPAARQEGWRRVLTPVGLFLLIIALVVILGIVMSIV